MAGVEGNGRGWRGNGKGWRENGSLRRGDDRWREEWVLEEGGGRMWRGNGGWRRGDGRGWRGRKLEDFDWVMIKFSDPSEGSVNMPIFLPHWQLMGVDFSIVLPFVFCW